MPENDKKMVLLTGANGFIGRHLLEKLNQDSRYATIASTRCVENQLVASVAIAVGDILPDTNWAQILLNIDAVIHLAARVHVMHDVSIDPLSAFRQINTEGTLNLARQAATAGVRRFVFISTIGVNGNLTASDSFNEKDKPNPFKPYAVSKYEAELGLRKIAAGTSMEVVIIRPPLVYGPNAPGNFGKLINILAHGIPLPLGAINNKRSLVALDNLIDLITTCIDHPAAVNQTFLVADGEDLSTTDLLRRLGKALGKPARLLPVHQSILWAVFSALGKRDIARQLIGSLQIDISKTSELLSWKPPVSVNAGLQKVADHYLSALLKK